jgi:dolichyl-phosphate-mannose-protein mannosyltransferase
VVAAGLLALLPIVCLVLLVSGAGVAGEDRRGRFLAGLVVWGFLVTLVAEATSLFHRFDRATVAALWAIAAAILAARAWRNRGGASASARAAVLSSSDRTLLAGIALVLAVVGVIAVAAAPNTWDALTYHLPRVAHWIQDRSVSDYPTHIVRQLYLFPWDEFIVSQLGLLSGSDRLANVIQWLALAGSLILVSRIAAQLGASGHGQVLSAAVAVSLPMAVLQGSSCQTDLATSLWVLAFASSVLASREGTWSAPLIFVLGGSLGLGVLTKPTAAIFLTPFFVWLAAIGIRRWGKRCWKPILAVAAIAAAPNIPHACRNISIFGSPLGTPRGYLNEAMGPRLFTGNVVRNLSLHAATPFAAANELAESFVVRLHQALGLDVGDPRTTWQGSEFHVPSAPLGGHLERDEAMYALFHEDTAGNPVQAVLAAVSLVVLAARRDLRSRRDLALFGAAIVVAFLLFCAVLKWQPWHARLHLPVFLLASALVALVLSRTLSTRVCEWTAVLLLASVLPWVAANATRPLLGAHSVLTAERGDQYFFARPGLETPYRDAAAAVANLECRQVGLVTGPDTPEYLFWVSLRRSLSGTFRVEHVAVHNRSAVRTPDLAPFSPCVIVTIWTTPEGEELRVEQVESR